MRKFAVTLAAAALVLGATALTANAQTQRPGSFHALAQNATPIQKAACNGMWGRCPPGRHWVCGPYRCWCGPCW